MVLVEDILKFNNTSTFYCYSKNSNKIIPVVAERKDKKRLRKRKLPYEVAASLQTMVRHKENNGSSKREKLSLLLACNTVKE